MAQAEDCIYDFTQNYCRKEDIENFNRALATADKKTIAMLQQLELPSAKERS